MPRRLLRPLIRTPGPRFRLPALRSSCPPTRPCRRRPRLLRADSLAPEPVEWLWRHHVALGKLTLIGGAPGSGKSTLALGLLAAVSSGGAWPCGEGHATQGSAILLNALILRNFFNYCAKNPRLDLRKHQHRPRTRCRPLSSKSRCRNVGTAPVE